MNETERTITRCPSPAVNHVGENSEQLAMTNNFTVVTACLGDGSNLKLVILLEKDYAKGAVPSGVLLHVQKGWMDGEDMICKSKSCGSVSRTSH